MSVRFKGERLDDRFSGAAEPRWSGFREEGTPTRPPVPQATRDDELGPQSERRADRSGTLG
jgi:hypothetical protein